jgi:hypothetical protein
MFMSYVPGLVIIAPQGWVAIETKPQHLEVRDATFSHRDLPVEAGVEKLIADNKGGIDLSGKALVVLDEPRSSYHSDGMFNSGGYNVSSAKAGLLRDDGTWEQGDLQLAFSDSWVRAQPDVALEDEGGARLILNRTLRFG